ncbi:hypothetical protein M2480_000576 [Parabacteroides sp. PFB2-12]|uniref:M50 family metallopeptidase n=1 Tax=unclassified Parabacteroides TaxID=2649774 RepID=UPI0024746F3A|nr:MULTISPECIES: M50 family metallopeptidase [unclassified Parabacteroides]MDH6341913.1 hypothetical protein [Parabacteroides sp. PM6-13]MDH6389611.1 hypothetical protein [Parabacteroides sp. PFB2-12]
MKRLSTLIGSLLLLILAALTIYDGYYFLVAAFKQLNSYLWLGVGFLSCIVVNKLLFDQLRLIKVHIHESAHVIVSWMFFRRVTSIEVRETDGMMYHIPGRIGSSFISLAPYCLPYLTYFFLIIRCFVMGSSVWIFDMIIGFTLALHVVCFKEQTNSNQPDLRQEPLYFSYLFIWTFRLFNLLLILLCFFKKSGNSLNLDGAIAYIFSNFYSTILNLFS